MRDCERYLNYTHRAQLGKRPITVYLIPPRDTLLANVAGTLMATWDRLKIVDFVVPEGQQGVSELLRTGPTSPVISRLDDLAGMTGARAPGVELLRRPRGAEPAFPLRNI